MAELSDRQRERIEYLNERLFLLWLSELDTSNWPGAGKTLAEMTQQERGDLMWTKNNVRGTGQLLVQMTTIMNNASLTMADRPAIDAVLAKWEAKAEHAIRLVKG